MALVQYYKVTIKMIKKTFIFIVIFTGILNASFLSRRTKDILSLWHMESAANCIDSIGANSTTATAGTVSNTSDGKVGWCKLLNDGGYSIATPSAEFIALQDFTFTGWVKWTGGTEADSGVMGYDDNGANRKIELWANWSPTALGFPCIVMSATGAFKINGAITFTRSCVGKWLFLATTVDSTNGAIATWVFFGSETYRSTDPIVFPVSSTANTTVYIGRRYNGATDQFQGYIDELALWRRVLSEREIRTLYKSVITQYIE